MTHAGTRTDIQGTAGSGSDGPAQKAEADTLHSDTAEAERTSPGKTHPRDTGIGIFRPPRYIGPVRHDLDSHPKNKIKHTPMKEFTLKVGEKKVPTNYILGGLALVAVIYLAYKFSR